MKHTLTSKEISWTNVQSPQPEELAEFVRESGMTTTDAEFIAQKYHRPTVSTGPDYMLLLIQIPVFDRKLRLTKGVSLFFIVKEKQLFSLHYEPIISLDKIRQEFETSKERLEEYFRDDPLSLCLDLITSLYDSSFKKLERLNKHIDIAEDAVFQGNEKKMVEEISLLSRDVMDFRKIIRPQKSLFMSSPRNKLMTGEIAIKWHRVHGHLLKMWEVLESMFESVKELSNTNFTLLQHKENELLRLLTVYSIIVIPMLILVDPYFAPKAPNATIIDTMVFWAVLATLVVTLTVILLKFRQK